MMAVRHTDRRKLVVCEALNPIYRVMLGSYTANLNLELVTVAHTNGNCDLAALAAALDGDTAAVLVQNPNFFGTLNDFSALFAAAKAAGAAGSYSAPAAMSLVAAVFEEAGALDRLERFVSEAGARFYGLAPNEGRLALRREPWVVPATIDGVAPLAAGRTLSWAASRA